MKLRVGFIGLGVMGLSHVKAMQRLCGDKAEVTALCGTNDANFQAAIGVAPGARRFKQASHLIHSELDAIFVSTPNFTHAKFAEEILGAGKHLFLEKPCGVTRDECLRVLEVASRSDRILMLGHELRYSPFFQKIKELVDRGEIGKPQWFGLASFEGPFKKNPVIGYKMSAFQADVWWTKTATTLI